MVSCFSWVDVVYMKVRRKLGLKKRRFEFYDEEFDSSKYDDEYDEDSSKYGEDDISII